MVECQIDQQEITGYADTGTEDKMSRVGIFLADGFEEIEGLTVVDILRRAGIDISMISINGKKKVTGAHGIALDTDEDIVQCDLDKLDIGNDFYSTQEIYKKLVDYGIDLLENDTTFTKMIYSYMIYHYELSGRDICLLLFDQGDIKYNAQEYTQVKHGITSPYGSIKNVSKLISQGSNLFCP